MCALRSLTFVVAAAAALVAPVAPVTAAEDPPAPGVEPPVVGTKNDDASTAPESTPIETAPAENAAKDVSAPRRPLQVGEALSDETVLTPVRAQTDDGPAPAPSPVRALVGEPKRPVVLLFWSRNCPVSRRYHTPFAALAKDFGTQATFAIVVSSHGDAPPEARQALADASIALPVFADADQATASRLGVRVTPTAVLFDAAGVLRYRGPVDDDRRAKNREPVQHLRDALAAVASGRAVEGPEPRPFGCALRRAPKKPE
jgi:hypothetical protein